MWKKVKGSKYVSGDWARFERPRDWVKPRPTPIPYGLFPRIAGNSVGLFNSGGVDLHAN